MGDQDGLLSSSSRVKVRRYLRQVVEFEFVQLCFSLLQTLQGTAIVKPILVGNTSRYFGKKREEDGHTHSWTVYVKPFHNEVND